MVALLLLAGWTVEPQHDVGYRLWRVEYDGQAGREDLLINVWYPTSDAPESYRYPTGVATEVAVDGAPLDGSYPIIIYSHGAGGSGLAAPYLTERLASRGFVVCAPDYVDEFNVQRSDGEGEADRSQMGAYLRWALELSDSFTSGTYDRAAFEYRPRTARFTLDAMLGEECPVRAIIDAEHVGAVGHSFGAYTTMMIAGVAEEVRDERLDAAVSLSGPVGEVYSAEEIAQIHVPLMIQFGEHEDRRGKLEGCNAQFEAANAPRILLGIADADHMTFGQPGRREVRSVADTYDDVRYLVITETTVALFEWALTGDEEARARLEQGDEPRLSLERHEF